MPTRPACPPVGGNRRVPGLRREEVARTDSVIAEPTEAIVRTVATCVCGSDLWPHRGLNEVADPRAIGHEYCGVVEQVGAAPDQPSPDLIPRLPDRYPM